MGWSHKRGGDKFPPKGSISFGEMRFVLSCEVRMS